MPFNLFTSFGYFENDEDNLTTLIAIKCLNMVLRDWFHECKLSNTLFQKKQKRSKELTFTQRYLKDGHIYKELTLKQDTANHY
jgi:hypothetical protein